jgi:hypothetical protein
MTSTRNKNMISDYRLQNLYNNNLFQYNLYQNSSYGLPSNSNIMPNIGYLPSKMSRDVLSNNAIDIESRLKGIGSTNLVEPQKPLKPDINNLEFKDWFDINRTIIMPFPFVHENENRPILD